MIDETLFEAEEKMDKAVEVAKEDFSTIRTGRANAAMFSKIFVDYYGSPTPLQQLASISAPEPRLLTIKPFDPASLKDIERAILASDLGLTPNNDGKLIRLGIPELNEERRRELVKVVRHIAEEDRKSVV